MVKIAILGCGLMGLKIAGELAYHGHRVSLYDNSLQALNSAYERVEEDKSALREEGLLAHQNFIGAILCFSRLEDTVKDADFIFEAVVDDLAIKQDLFERAASCCRADAVICTNTLTLDIDAIFDRTTHKHRTVGLRFLFPVYYIPEVELRPNKFTKKETIEKVRTLLERMGKTLFFRSGGDPLILTEEQREARKQARLEQIRASHGLGSQFNNALPALAHPGNVQPNQDEPDELSDNERDCAICMDRHRDCLLCPCHHMVTCTECAKSLLNRRDGCPICRKEITEVIKVYHS